MDGRTVKKGEISLESLLPSNLSTEERERRLKILREKEERAFGTSPSTPNSSEESPPRREVLDAEKMLANWKDAMLHRGDFKDAEEY